MKEIDELEQKIDSAKTKLDIPSKSKELDAISKQMSQPNFWSDSAKAQSLSQKHAQLEKQVKPWQDLSSKLGELKQLDDLGGRSLEDELLGQLKHLEKRYTELEKSLRFSGPYDDHSALITLQAGAGGKDAQDWAQKLE